jgi:hypothetical protein
MMIHLTESVDSATSHQILSALWRPSHLWQSTISSGSANLQSPAAVLQTFDLILKNINRWIQCHMNSLGRFLGVGEKDMAGADTEPLIVQQTNKYAIVFKTGHGITIECLLR